MTRTTWSDSYPSQTRLRSEVRAMFAAIRTVLLAEIGESRIRGIYAKGSATRPWDTLIDYVPEISDVDVHVWLVDEPPALPLLYDLDVALAIQAGLARAYREAVGDPLHLPRPQIMPINLLVQDPAFVLSPPQIVEVLYGEPHPHHGQKSHAEIRRIDAEHLQENHAAMAEFPLHLMDKPDKYVWSAVRTLGWRVSPTGARVLDLLGMDPDDAWSMNRSGVVRALRELGQDALADKLEDYYLAAWDYYLSGLTDTSAARTAIRAGIEAVNLGYAVCTPG